MLKKILSIADNIKNKLDGDNITLYAAQSSFFIIISSIPFMMLLIAVARMVIPFHSYTIMAMLEPYIPYSYISITEYLVKEVYDKSASVSVMSASVLALIWSAPKGLVSLGTGICTIYEQPASNFIKQRLISILYTIVFIVVIVAVLVFMVFGRVIYIFEKITEGPAATMSVLTLFFSVMYYVFSKRRLSYVKNIPGSLAAAAGWFVFSYIFGIYIDKFANYSYIYGSIGTLVGFMVWLYVCMNIVLLGAELNVYLFMNMRRKKNNDEQISSVDIEKQ